MFRWGKLSCAVLMWVIQWRGPTCLVIAYIVRAGASTCTCPSFGDAERGSVTSASFFDDVEVCGEAKNRC